MKCNRCGEDKPPEEFYKREKICKDCKKKLRNRKRGVKRALITRYLGKLCVICGEKGTTSHEKYGQPHRDLLNASYKELKQNCKSGRFVKVCYGCHQKVHSLMDRDITSLEITQHYVKEFLKTNPPKERYAHLWSWDRFIDVKLNKPVGQQLELPVEVETVKTKMELEVERALAEEHRNVPHIEGSLIDGTGRIVETEDRDDWEDYLVEDEQRITPRPLPKKRPPSH